MKYFREESGYLIPTGLKKLSRELYIDMIKNDYGVIKHKTISGRTVARVQTRDGSPIKNLSWIHFSRLKEQSLIYKDTSAFFAVKFKKVKSRPTKKWANSINAKAQ